ncbi:DeoR family transcriptional regulator OS=Streptomyces antimycoticus OX=68175 GN=SANT12839_094080 PE=4 SV=1 [Streptomyces antimycoticus]
MITSNLAVSTSCADDTAVELVLLGGVLRREYRSLVGFLTEDNLRQLHADWLFLGTSGVRPRRADHGQHHGHRGPGETGDVAASDQVVLLADRGQVPRHRPRPRSAAPRISTP